MNSAEIKQLTEKTDNAMSKNLFRAKRLDNGEWVYGGYYHTYRNGDYVRHHIVTEDKEDHLVDGKTVGQFSGYYDIYDSSMIFTDDIVEFNNNSKDLGKVVFGTFKVVDREAEKVIEEVDGWHVEVIPTDALSVLEPFCFPTPLTDFYIEECNMAVIGNIHDNPELLEVCK